MKIFLLCASSVVSDLPQALATYWLIHYTDQTTKPPYLFQIALKINLINHLCTNILFLFILQDTLECNGIQIHIVTKTVWALLA